MDSWKVLAAQYEGHAPSRTSRYGWKGKEYFVGFKDLECQCNEYRFCLLGQWFSMLGLSFLPSPLSLPPSLSSFLPFPLACLLSPLHLSLLFPSAVGSSV